MMIISEDLNRSLRDFTVVIVRVRGLHSGSLQGDSTIAAVWNFKNYRAIWGRTIMQIIF